MNLTLLALAAIGVVVGAVLWVRGRPNEPDNTDRVSASDSRRGSQMACNLKGQVMNAPQYTPGPWEVFEPADGELVVRTSLDGDADEHGRHIIVGGETVATITDVEREHFNAHLIAAAPELYEALMSARLLVPNYHPLLIKQCDVAIFKARGGA